MAAAGLTPAAIVLAVGSAVVGGPEALRLLLAIEARTTTAADVAICAFLVCAFTALILGTLLLARFFRDDARPRAGAGPAGAHAPGTERFARVTLMVALAVLLFVTSSLLLVGPDSLTGTGTGGLGGVRSCSA